MLDFVKKMLGRTTNPRPLISDAAPGLRFRKLGNQERSRLLLPPLTDRQLKQYANDEEDEIRAIKNLPGHHGAACYSVINCAAPTTAAPVKQPTGTAIRTMMLLKLGAAFPARIVEWGCSFDGTAAATGQVELFETTVAATMSTAYLAADIMTYNDPNAIAENTVANLPIDITGTSTSGFATAAVTEGTVANYRLFDAQQLSPTAPYVKQFPLGREPGWKPGNFVRCRMTYGVTVNAYVYVIFEV